MNTKRTGLQALVGQQERAEKAMSEILKIPYGSYRKRSKVKGRHSADYQGPMDFGSGTQDRMPGTSGYQTKQPNLIDGVLDALKIKKFKPTDVRMKPTPRPNPMPGVT